VEMHELLLRTLGRGGLFLLLHFTHLPVFERAVMKRKALLAESVTEDSSAATVMKTAAPLA